MKEALLASLAAALLLAQAAPQQPIRSEANFVRLDVHPTAHGKAVTDLTLEDFELLEDGVRQAIDRVEYVSRPALNAATTRADPSSAEASRQAVAAARGHVFVLFLDAAHVSGFGSKAIGEPLARLVDRIVGPDDLIGVMTADMSAAHVVFGRKTDVIRHALVTNPEWGRRFERTKWDQREQEYAACYPLTRTEAQKGRMLSAVAQELVERRRERMTLDAFAEIIAVVATTTQARTTVLTVTEGWALYRPSTSLLEPRVYDENDPKSPVESAPGRERIRVTPAGKLGMGDRTDVTSLKYTCETDRLRLANIDDRQDFHDLVGLANRHNVSFYTIDPRGLTPFDTAIQADPPRGVKNGLDWDHASLQSRQGSMRDLANNTDGLAVMNSLQFDRNLQHIVDDLASYYLLGYYSTNARLDGKFREITVRVKRPDVEVRARRGYRAPTKAEIETKTAAAPPVPPAPATAMLAKPSVFRRGPATGNRLAPVTDLVFSRTERLHLELPLEAGMKDAAARFLDRAGQPMGLPVTVGERVDPDGTRWLTADVTLAPLAPGTYAIELAATDATGVRTVLTGIQVTR